MTKQTIKSNLLTAFEFDERVVATKNTVQLLMIRLGIDGFYCGKRKIFLKYYHVDFLSKTYNEQYRRIVTVQSAARRYLAKIRAEREKCSRLANSLLVTKKIIRRWRSYKARNTCCHLNKAKCLLHAVETPLSLLHCHISL